MHEESRSTTALIVAGVILVIVFVAAIFSTASACSRPEKETLIVGTNTPFPPFEMRNGEDVVGFDIDLAQEIAKALGRKLVVKDFSEFDALLPSLTAEELDMAISSLTIRSDREEVVDFSSSYFAASQGILTRKGSAFSYSGNTAVFAGKRIGYQQGTTSEFWLEENVLGRVADIRMSPFGDLEVGLQFLRLGSVDLIVLDEPVAASFAKAHGDLAVAGVIATGEEYGVAVREGDPDKLLPVVNRVLARLHEDGTYDKLIEKWFGGEK